MFPDGFPNLLDSDFLGLSPFLATRHRRQGVCRSTHHALCFRKNTTARLSEVQRTSGALLLQWGRSFSAETLLARPAFSFPRVQRTLRCSSALSDYCSEKVLADFLLRTVRDRRSWVPGGSPELDPQPSHTRRQGLRYFRSKQDRPSSNPTRDDRNARTSNSSFFPVRDPDMGLRFSSFRNSSLALRVLLFFFICTNRRQKLLPLSIVRVFLPPIPT